MPALPKRTATHFAHCRRHRPPRRLQGIHGASAAAAACGGTQLLVRASPEERDAPAPAAAPPAAAVAAAAPAAGGATAAAAAAGHGRSGGRRPRQCGAAAQAQAAVQVLPHVRRPAGAGAARRQLAARVHAGARPRRVLCVQHAAAAVSQGSPHLRCLGRSGPHCSPASPHDPRTVPLLNPKPQCQYVDYQNPRMVVGTIVQHEGRILLCRRGIEPQRGLWTVPAGEPRGPGRSCRCGPAART